MFASLKYQIKHYYWNFSFALLQTLANIVQRPLMLLEVSTRQGLELHLDISNFTGACAVSWGVYTKGALHDSWRVYNTEASAAPGCVNTTGARAASGVVYTLQRPLLHLRLDWSTLRVLSRTWTWLDKYPKNPVISLFTFTIILSVDLIYVLSNCPRPICGRAYGVPDYRVLYGEAI